jgi:RNA polymerase sigma factor (sigma-70 family)
MSKGATALLSCLRTTARSVDLGHQSDRELLDAFVATKDPQAFAALLRRHAPLVMAACRQVLRDEADVEDAFQATFLVLHQKAGTIRTSQSVGSWLFCVARRMALAARRGATRRHECEGRVDPRVAESPPDLTWAEVRDILHDEIEKLPEHYRLPVLLCYVEGKSREEAATQLDWTSGTLIGRLERGRKMLRSRLLKRGVGLAAVLLAVIGDSAQASVSLALVHDTIRAVTRGELAPRVVALLHGASPMILGKFKLMIALLLAAGVLACAAGFAGAGRDKPTAAKDESKAAPAAKPDAPAAPADVSKEAKYQGTVLDEAGKPISGAVLKLPDKEVARSDEQGRFEFTTATSRNSRLLPPVIVTAEGKAPDWTLLGENPQLTFRLREPMTIRGRLIDLQGKPIAGAKVKPRAIEGDTSRDIKVLVASFMDRFGGTPMSRQDLRPPSLVGLPNSVTTDAAGRFEIKGVGRGRIVVLGIEADGFELRTLRVVADESFDAKELAKQRGEVMEGRLRRPRPTLVPADFDFALRPTRPIAGTVRDAATGKPLAGVQINGGVEEAWWEDHAIARTDADGRYKLLGLPKAARCRLIFFPGEGSAYLQSGRIVNDAEGLGPLTADVAMIRGVKLAGRVTDKATGKPVAGAGLLYSPLEGNKAAEAMKGTNIENFGSVGYRSDGDGRFTITVPPGLGVVTASLEPQRQSRAVYTQAAIRPEDQAHAFKDKDGGLGEAFISIGGRIVPLMSRNAYVMIDPPAEAAEFKCEIQLDPGSSAMCKVVDADGKPLAGARVSGELATWDQPETLKGDSFAIRAINPDRPRTIAAIHDARKLAGVAQVTGKVTEVAMRLQPWGALTGRIVDADGKPIAGAEVRILFRDYTVSGLAQERWSFRTPPKSDADGRFRFEGIIPDQKFGLSVSANRRFTSIGEGFREITVKSGETHDLGNLTARPIDQ